MRLLASLLGLGILIVASYASAQTEETHATDAVEMEDDAARGLYEVASAHYAAGRLVDAAHEFEEAYRLSHRPLLLYNAYVAYRDANMRAESARTLRAYLDSGVTEPRRPNLEARLAALEADLGSVSTQAVVVDPVVAPVIEEPIAPPPTTTRSNDLATVVAPILLVSAGVLIVAAAITGGLAVAKHDELTGACPAGACDPSRQGDIDSLSSLALATDIIGGIGIATAIAGVVVLGVGLGQSGSESPRATVSFGPGGISLRGSF